MKMLITQIIIGFYSKQTDRKSKNGQAMFSKGIEGYIQKSVKSERKQQKPDTKSNIGR